ncbi:glucose 1-dehydrogenase [Chryseobacterium lathyri]|uniref:3alpha(Or 20beta)-hydroxysteroid dehydrogenase n=1 Tax=Chryseobacterium lathyri TaxID=395933 RepID=A0ABT9SMS4_9FLAO|nr:glucose 1-dehydrogenase [Chryseobacterium lathyri]MDP9960743.1 3alpha(or 20beta)-hydroxysteroid dehydrogenase [Chryseobacterium lathyri]
MNRLKGKVAIITGAASGMGAAHAVAFVAEGAKVVLTDINEEKGLEVAKSLGDHSALFVKHDVSSKEDWDKVIEATEKTFGPVDILVNNAGIDKPALLEEMPEALYRQVIEINQVSVFLGMKAVIPSMKKGSTGSIVNISSIAGFVAAPYRLAYSASKFAVRGMTKSAAVELAKYNIRVNSVHPGLIDTPMTSAVPKEELSKINIPLGRAADAKEVSSLVVYLASDESSYSTGSEFIIDGGITAQL